MSGVEHYWVNDLTPGEVNRRVDGYEKLGYGDFVPDYINSPRLAQKIVEREKITSDFVNGEWVAGVPQGHELYGTFALGKTAHEAQMRMYLLIKEGL